MSKRGLAHDELNHRDEDEIKHKWKAKLIDNIELITNYNQTRNKVSLKQRLSNPNSKSLRTIALMLIYGEDEMEWEL
jgi:hypothetical protein